MGAAGGVAGGGGGNGIGLGGVFFGVGSGGPSVVAGGAQAGATNATSSGGGGGGSAAAGRAGMGGTVSGSMRHRCHISCELHDHHLNDATRLHQAILSNSALEIGSINLADMDPDEIQVSVVGSRGT